MKKRWVVGILVLVLLLTVSVSLLVSPIEHLIEQAGVLAYIIYVLLIITEAVIAPIPGGVLALLGAANFGFWKGWMLNYLGNVIGAQIAFLLARKYGRPLLNKLVKKSSQRRYDQLMGAHPVILYFVYAIPLLPIDIISLMLGVSSTRYRTFATISVLGLISYSGILAYLGATFGREVPYLKELTVAAVVLILVCICVWAYRQRSK